MFHHGGPEGLYGSSEHGNHRQAPACGGAGRLSVFFQADLVLQTKQASSLALVAFCVVNKNQCRQTANWTDVYVSYLSIYSSLMGGGGVKTKWVSRPEGVMFVKCTNQEACPTSQR